MAKVDVIKTSFTGGVFGPSLLGRTDISQYENAVKEAYNMLVRPYGPMISTPGTRYVAECKMSALGTDSTVKLIEFIFNQSDAYTIEMGEKYFRFYTDRGQVVLAYADVDLWVSSTSYYPGDYAKQPVGGVYRCTVAHTAGTGAVNTFDWDISAGYWDQNDAYEIAHPYTAEEVKEVQYAQLNDLIWFAHPNHPPQVLTRYAANSWTIEDYDFLGGPFLDDMINPIGNFPPNNVITVSATAGSNITITLVNTTTTLNQIGFVSSDATTRGHVGTYWKFGGIVTTETTALQGYFRIDSVSNPQLAYATAKTTLSTTSSIIAAEPAWSDVAGWPARVQFHEGRLYWGRTDTEPQGVWGSHSFIYDQYALDEQADGEGINIKLASNQSNEIQWLASGNSLLAGTYGGAFVINGGAESTITPTNITAKQEVSFGTEAIQPRRIGSFFYYVQRFNKKVRELFYLWENNAFKATDKTILAPEITGDGIVDIAYQEVPDTILWCVTTQGTICTMTREIDQEVQGWTVQDTAGGMYESIACIPSQSHEYDEPWVVVKRTVNGTTKRYIEYFENIEPPDRQERMVYLQSSLEFDAYLFTAAAYSNCTISIAATAGTTVALSCSTGYFTTSDEGLRIRAINGSASTIGEFYIKSCASSTLVYGDVRYTFSASTIGAGYWGKSTERISGMDHLEGETVKVLADGGVDKPDKVVSNGTVALAYNYFIVQCGIGYDQKMETLPWERGSQRGTSQGKIQKINQVAFKVNRSFRGFKVGGTEAKAEKVSFREPTTLMGTPEDLLTGVLANINLKDDYRYGSTIYVKNSEPLPIEILSIIAMLDTHDKG